MTGSYEVVADGLIIARFATLAEAHRFLDTSPVMKRPGRQAVILRTGDKGGPSQRLTSWERILADLPAV